MSHTTVGDAAKSRVIIVADNDHIASDAAGRIPGDTAFYVAVVHSGMEALRIAQQRGQRRPFLTSQPSVSGWDADLALKAGTKGSP
jgi:hypothetical protein